MYYNINGTIFGVAITVLLYPGVVNYFEINIQCHLSAITVYKLIKCILLSLLLLFIQVIRTVTNYKYILSLI